MNRYPKYVYYHAIRVAKLVSEYNNSTDYELVALLHDIIEDTDTSLDEIPVDIKEDIDILTRRKEETYFDYIETIKKYGTKRAFIVKLCDLKDHLNQKDTLTVSLKKRYLKALSILND